MPSKKSEWERIGRVIAEARKRHDETQEELASAVDVARNTVSQYEHGTITIPMRVREIASKRYGIAREEVGLERIDAHRTSLESKALDLAVAVLKSDVPAEVRDLALLVITEGLSPDRL